MVFPKFCRACTKEIDKQYEGIHLFEENSDVIDRFAKCTALEVDKSDNLPAYICEECNINLINFHQFRLTCENSDRHFRQKLVELKIERPEIEELDHEKVTYVEEIVKLENNFIESDTTVASKKFSSIEDAPSYECEICRKTFYKKRVIEGHLRNHCGLKAFPCDLCDEGFAKWNRLMVHKRESHRNEIAEVSQAFRCDYDHCTKSYNHVKSLQDHVKRVHLNIKRSFKTVDQDTRHKCPHCGKTYKKKESFDGHIRQHQGLDPFECKLCNATFQKWRSLLLHNESKHNEDFQKLPCGYDGCDKAFTTKFGLKEHINNIHLGIKKPKIQPQISYVCELCGKSFKNKTSLKKHSYSHTGERPFPCTYCPKRFTVKDKLKNHILRHENIKNFECSHCGMKKVTMAELKIHMNSHTMDKVYACPQCPAVFSRDGNAKRHFRIVHRGYKPYKCTTCSQWFSKKETLKHHEMTHSGEKPHACHICDKRFIQPIALKKHLKVHNKQLPVLATNKLLISNVASIAIVNS